MCSSRLESILTWRAVKRIRERFYGMSAVQQNEHLLEVLRTSAERGEGSVRAAYKQKYQLTVPVSVEVHTQTRCDVLYGIRVLLVRRVL